MSALVALPEEMATQLVGGQDDGREGDWESAWSQADTPVPDA
jgi:hypothetical protein